MSTGMFLHLIQRFQQKFTSYIRENRIKKLNSPYLKIFLEAAGIIGEFRSVDGNEWQLGNFTALKTNYHLSQSLHTGGHKEVSSILADQ